MLGRTRQARATEGPDAHAIASEDEAIGGFVEVPRAPAEGGACGLSPGQALAPRCRKNGLIPPPLAGDETTTLLRQEVDLAKTEMSEKASRFGTNVAALAIHPTFVAGTTPRTQPGRSSSAPSRKTPPS